MKKLLPIAMIAVVCMLFTSCKKDYTCTCTMTDNSVTPANVTTETFSLGKQTKSNATSACNAEVGSMTSGGVGITIACHL